MSTSDREEVSTAATDAPTINATYRVNRTPQEIGTVDVTYQVTFPSNVVAFRLTPRMDNQSGIEFHSTTGFDRNGSEYVWDGKTTNPTITYTAPANASTEFGLRTVETPEWAFISEGTVYFKPRWSYFGEAPTYVDSLEAVSTGFGSDTYVFLGAYQTHDRQTARHRLTLVEPAAATMQVAPDTVLAGVGRAGNQLAIDGVRESVVVYAVPDPMRRGGESSGAAYWVNEQALLNSTENTWYHEYVHTRQNFSTRTSERTYWLVEGSAEYYAAYLTWQQNRVTDTAYRTKIATETNADKVLSQAQRGDSDFTEYDKGARVMAALDLELRNRTDGEKTLMDVLRRVNNYDGSTLSYTAFTDIVATVAGERMDAWLDRYTTTTAAPTIPANVTAAYSQSTGVDDGTTTVPFDLQASAGTTTPNSTATVTFNFTNRNDTSLAGPAVKVTEYPTAWTITSHEDAGGTYSESSGVPTWLWLSVPAGGSKRPSITFRIPNSTTPGEYTVRGQAIGPDDTTVNRSVNITVSQDTTQSIEQAIAGDDNTISIVEIQQAIRYWSNGNTVPNTGGKTIGLVKVQKLVRLWANGEAIQ